MSVVQGTYNSHKLQSSMVVTMIFVSRALSLRVFQCSFNCGVELALGSMATSEQLALDDLAKVHKLVQTQGNLMSHQSTC